MAFGPELRFLDRTKVLYEGKAYLFFGGNDYHRLATHPDVIRAARDVAESDGWSCAGSRITTGNHPLLAELERRAATFLGAGEAVLCPSGYLSNCVALETMSGDFQRVFLDGGAHASLATPTDRSPREMVVAFRHADPEDLARRLHECLRPGERPLVLTDGVEPGDGELPPLHAYWAAVRDFGGVLLVDDAHGIGVLGPNGMGSPAEAGLPADAFMQTGTFSKALGAFGGLVTGPAGLAERVIEKSRAFVGATPIPPPLAAAGIRALEILQASPGLITGLRSRVLRVRERVQALGFRASASPAPILSITHHDVEKNSRLRSLLLDRGIYPPLIRYPGSPPGGHFRFTISSAHAEEDIERLLDTLAASCG